MGNVSKQGRGTRLNAHEKGSCVMGNANEQGRGIRSNAHEKGSCVMGNVSKQGRKCACCVRATGVQAGVLTAKDYAPAATFCLGAHRKART